MKSCLLLIAFITLPVNGEEIHDLPGLSFKPNFKHYSGYFNVSETHFLHYWFVESQKDPTTDPLIFWFNGGPGCSSLDGLLQEMGPYLVNEDGETLRQNPNAWNRFANVLNLEAPAGVGYSYSSDGNVTFDDDEVAADNYEAVKLFFTEFPQFRNHSTFIFGESYAGVYVPTLAALVLDGQEEFQINFKGVGIGNGFLNEDLDLESKLEFLHTHGLISEASWNKFETDCCSHCFDTCDWLNITKECLGTAVDLNQLLPNINQYDIYADCDTASIDGARIVAYGPGHNHVRWEDGSEKPNLSVPCLNDTAFTKYMNREDVREALYIPKDLPDWSICSDGVFFSYIKTYFDMSPDIYKLIDAKIPILLYYGDTDTACNFLGAQEFSAGLGLTLLQDKAPWIVDGQVGGFSTVYKGLTFTTVRGAGHMVCLTCLKIALQAPQWRAPQTAYVVQQFLLNKPI